MLDGRCLAVPWPVAPGSLASLLNGHGGSTWGLPLRSSGLGHGFPLMGCVVSLFLAPRGLLVAWVWGPFMSAPDHWTEGCLWPPSPIISHNSCKAFAIYFAYTHTQACIHACTLTHSFTRMLTLQSHAHSTVVCQCSKLRWEHCFCGLRLCWCLCLWVQQKKKRKSCANQCSLQWSFMD